VTGLKHPADCVIVSAPACGAIETVAMKSAAISITAANAA
jgi:hypothetical protein